MGGSGGIRGVKGWLWSTFPLGGGTEGARQCAADGPRPSAAALRVSGHAIARHRGGWRGGGGVKGPFLAESRGQGASGAIPGGVKGPFLVRSQGAGVKGHSWCETPRWLQQRGAGGGGGEVQLSAQMAAQWS
jgi:hypothetical protein